jgi:hypothetical protein
VAGFDDPDAPGRHAVAMAGGGDADQPIRLKPKRVEIIFLRGRSHGRSALAGGETDHASFRDGVQVLRQHDIRMRGGDGSVENRAQERASVGHGVTESSREEKGMQRPYPTYSGKRKPLRCAGQPEALLLDFRHGQDKPGHDEFN